MITIVTSTRKIEDSFQKMLTSTVGLKDVQILTYENNGVYSLTELYNKGIKESKFDIIVFCHDDITIETKDWGKKLIEHYSKSEYGILGVGGTNNLDSNGCWWTYPQDMYGIVKHTDGEKTWTNSYSKNIGNNIEEMVVVDGVFFSINKKRIKANFDEDFKGFHYYDISFCYENYLKGVQVGLHTNISIIHNSVGQTNEKWEMDRQQFVNKYISNLPAKLDLEVPYHEVNKKLKKEEKLAIIIPTKDKVEDLLVPCLLSIIEGTKYSNYKIYVADTGSDETNKKQLKKYIKHFNKEKEIIKLIEYDYYNFAKINNDVVKNHIDKDTELILFCNNDVELINDAITQVVETYQNNKSKIGTVGARLHYEDGRIQHMGMALQVNRGGNVKITHKFLGWNYKNLTQSKTTVQTHGNTGAFLLISKELFESVGCFNETYVECFEDVELNLKCFLKGKMNMTNSNAVAYHYESQSRGQKIDQEDVKMLMGFIERNVEIKKTFYLID